MKIELEFDKDATVDLQDASPFDIKCILRAIDDVQNDVSNMKRLYFGYVNDSQLEDEDQIELEMFNVGKLLEHIRWLAECVSDLID